MLALGAGDAFDLPVFFPAGVAAGGRVTGAILSTLGVAEGFSATGVTPGFSGVGVVSGGFPAFWADTGFSVGFGVGVALGVGVGFGVGVALGVAAGFGVGVGRGEGVVLAGLGVVSACSASGAGDEEGLCVPRRGVGVATGSGAGVGVALGLCFFEPNSHSKKERFLGFGVGSACTSELTDGDGVAAGLPGFVAGLVEGFSLLPAFAGLFSSGFFSPVVAEAAGVPCVGAVSWA